MLLPIIAAGAQGGAGLIITEGAYVNHPSAGAYENVPFFYGEQALAGWKKVVDEVHAAGAKIAPSCGTPALCAARAVKEQHWNLIPMCQLLAPPGC